MESNFAKDFRRPIMAVLVIGSLFLAAATVGAITSWDDGESQPVTKTITVNGKGEVLAVPDTAVFTFSVTEEAKTVGEAQKKTTDKTNKAITYLKGQGIDEKDIKTVGYNVNPRYEYINVACVRFPCPQSQNLLGYEVSQSIEVKVRDTTKAGTLLSGIGTQEVQNVSGLNFQIDDEEKLKDEARQKAITDARDQAKVLADQLGVRLGKVVSFSESGNFPIYYAREAYGKGGADMAVTNQAAPAPEVPAGQNEVISNVTITYEIR